MLLSSIDTGKLVLACAFFSLVSASLLPRILNDPVNRYISSVCYPLLTNGTRQADLGLSTGDIYSSLANSPFPCEQQLYLNQICVANGTTPADFLAEQQCLCNGAFFDVMSGCDACLFSHGSELSSPPEDALSSLSSLSTAECSPSPPFQPFSNLLPPVTILNLTELSLRPPRTLGNDQFPSNTEVSNYFTPTRSITAGEITGSATARLTSWTNFDGVRFTPTNTPSTSPSANPTTDAATSTSSASSTASAPSTAETDSAAAAAVQTHLAGKALAIVMVLAAFF